MKNKYGNYYMEQNKYEFLTKEKEEMLKDINDLKKDKEITDALLKLNNCLKKANNTFKNEYRKYFELDDYDNNIPDLIQFMENPPHEEKHKRKYEFWKMFCEKYPNSDNKDFVKICKRMER